ncbi:MAG: hypothetical protein VX899_14795 [Myxococcota bacterium]|nr:hypothetical protein [Myxococcota bacterium]
MPFEVRAPGKLFVLGEYAVTDGAPALVLAVDRGVRCSVAPGDALLTPGDDRFARAALEAVGAPARTYRFSNWNPPKLRSKAGFGGSAAACTAGVIAGTLAAGGPVDEALCELAVRTHQRVQGSGSGMDVRASFHGGLRWYEGAQVGAPEPVLAVTAVYSGSSASTGPRVVRYKAWSGREPFVDQSRALKGLWQEDPLAAMREGLRLLTHMSRQAGVAYLTPGLERIIALATEHGGAAKPSGAGGGDVAVAWVPDPDARASFEAACTLEGLPVLPIQTAPGAKETGHGADA